MCPCLKRMTSMVVCVLVIKILINFIQFVRQDKLLFLAIFSTKLRTNDPKRYILEFQIH